MTRAEDIIRQVETLLADRRYPPTLSQKEISTVILYRIHAGITDFQGRY